MSTMVMVMGPTGCGKSTFRKKHLFDYPCVSPDDFIVGKWTHKKTVHAWQHARNMAIEMLIDGTSFVVDAQFIDPAVRAEWTALARGFKFRVRAFAFDTPWKQLRKNQQARGARGFYGVIPFKVQQRSYQLFKQQLKAEVFMNEGFLRPPLSRSCFPYSTIRIVKWGEPIDDVRWGIE